MIGGAISLWLLGVSSVLLRNVPQKIFLLIKKHVTTRMQLTSGNKSFYIFLEWLNHYGHSNKFRSVKYTNGRWGDEKGVKTTKGVGYGSHLFFFKKRPLMISLEREQSTDCYDKEVLTIAKIGRSHKLFDRMMEEAIKLKEEENKIRIYTLRSGEWCCVGKQPIRNLDSIVIKDSDKNKLINCVEKFISKEDWYIERGIPYSLGILLYGPPGTGKTSLIKGLASYLKRSIYMVDSLTLTLKPECLNDFSDENAIIVIEDIDSCNSAKKRDNNFNENMIKNDFEEMKEKLIGDVSKDFLNNTSGLLNALDGVVVNHGRIMIMTTNYPEKLDSALLRPGRCDLKLEVGYFDIDMFKTFLYKFFEKVEVDKMLLNRRINEKVTGANLQNDILFEMSLKEVVDKNTQIII